GGGLLAVAVVGQRGVPARRPRRDEPTRRGFNDRGISARVRGGVRGPIDPDGRRRRGDGRPVERRVDLSPRGVPGDRHHTRRERSRKYTLPFVASTHTAYRFTGPNDVLAAATIG